MFRTKWRGIQILLNGTAFNAFMYNIYKLTNTCFFIKHKYFINFILLLYKIYLFVYIWYIFVYTLKAIYYFPTTKKLVTLLRAIQSIILNSRDATKIPVLYPVLVKVFQLKSSRFMSLSIFMI